MKYVFVIAVGIYMLCAPSFSVWAQGSEDSWLAQEKSVRAAIDAGRINDAAVLAIKILQQLKRQPVAEDDPTLERFYTFDLGDIRCGILNPSDRMTIAKWEYSTAQIAWGRHSVPYHFALTSMSSANMLLTKQFKATDQYTVEAEELRKELSNGPKAALLREWDKNFWEQTKQSLKRSSEKMQRASDDLDKTKQRFNHIRAEQQKP